MNPLQQAIQQLPRATAFAIQCRIYKNKPEGGAGYDFDLSEEEPTTRHDAHDYRDQQGNPSNSKDIAEVMGLTATRVITLYQQHNDDWKYIYNNYGKTKNKAPRWLDHNGQKTTVPEIAKHYQCKEYLVYRAFIKADGNSIKAHQVLKIKFPAGKENSNACI